MLINIKLKYDMSLRSRCIAENLRRSVLGLVLVVIPRKFSRGATSRPVFSQIPRGNLCIFDFPMREFDDVRSSFLSS